MRHWRGHIMDITYDADDPADGRAYGECRTCSHGFSGSPWQVEDEADAHWAETAEKE